MIKIRQKAMNGVLPRLMRNTLNQKVFTFIVLRGQYLLKGPEKLSSQPVLISIIGRIYKY